MKKLITICICTLMLSIFGGCGDEDHITQKEAQKIAEGLIGEEGSGSAKVYFSFQLRR